MSYLYSSGYHLTLVYSILCPICTLRTPVVSNELSIEAGESSCQFIIKQITLQLNLPDAGIGCLEISVPETVEGDTAIVKISLDIPVGLIIR